MALLHDVILTVGVFSLLQIDFDLTTIAALLTIIGYSMNDTVVVYDRVREELRKYKKMPLKDVINLSLNKTLSKKNLSLNRKKQQNKRPKQKKPPSNRKMKP